MKLPGATLESGPHAERPRGAVYEAYRPEEKLELALRLIERVEILLEDELAGALRETPFDKEAEEVYEVEAVGAALDLIEAAGKVMARMLKDWEEAVPPRWEEEPEGTPVAAAALLVRVVEGKETFRIRVERPRLERLLPMDFRKPAAGPRLDGPDGNGGQPETTDPVSGWRPRKVGNDWGAVLEGQAVADLPDDLRGTAIAITDRKGESWNATVTEVVERGRERIVVRHTGRPRT